MRRLILALLLLSILVVSGLSGCSQKTENLGTNNEVVTGIDPSATKAADISSDLESLSKEVAGIDTNDTAMVPITEADLAD